MVKFQVLFYEKENGECPVEEFLSGLDIKMWAKMVGMLQILEEKGNLLREPYSKHLEDGIFEIRCELGNRMIRVMYFFFMRGKLFLQMGLLRKHKKHPG